jgi:Mitochondrial ribosomal protein L37
MIGCASQWGTSCRRLFAFGNRLVTQKNHIREISVASTLYAAKPGGMDLYNIISVVLFKAHSFAVAIGSLGSKATSKKKLGKLGSATEKLVLSAETDTQKLHDYVCGSNLLKEGGEEIKIQPDSEYPDWLWTLRTGELFLLFIANHTNSDVYRKIP